MKNPWRTVHRCLFLIGVVFACLTSGCAVVATDVITFHRLPAKGGGETFTILPPSSAGQIESASYVTRIAGHLQRYGWRKVSDRAAAIAVGFEYGVSGRRETHSSLPIYGQTGGGTSYHSGTFSSAGAAGTQSGTVTATTYSTPTYGVVNVIPISQSYYNRFLLIIARDRSGTELFEIRCESKGTLSEISRVLPTMIDAAFSDFPGVSGSTKQRLKPRAE